VSDLEPGNLSPDLRSLMAQRKVELAAFRIVSERLLELSFGASGDGRKRMELLLFFGKSLPEWVYSMRSAIAEARLTVDESMGGMEGDLQLLEVGSSLLDWHLQKLLF
jgi:hypothetical protein